MLHQLRITLNQNPMPEFSKGLPAPRGILLGLILYTEWYGLPPLLELPPKLTGTLFMPPPSPPDTAPRLMDPEPAKPCVLFPKS